ncbi:hypothetical protein [Haliangium sp.]|uniref:hypothetical protein n=1 Tax=Haliangium sp. TaxID=2663208 RepID=UPI003D130925
METIYVRGRRRAGVAWWAPALTLALAACKPIPPAEDPEDTPPETDAMTFNAMTFNSLMLDHDLAIGDTPLAEVVATGSAFEPHLSNDPYALEFMEYLVSCALPTGDALTWTDSTGTVSETWPGDLGLCPAWKTDKPDEACQELVSACLLTRVNAYGEKVELSLRGLHTDDSPLPMSSTEKSNFGWQEGGFYGNIFCPDCVDPRLDIKIVGDQVAYFRRDPESGRPEPLVVCESTPIGKPEQNRERDAVRTRCHQQFLQKTRYAGVVYQAMFACWSSIWSEGEAYTRRRICAGQASTGGVVDDQNQCAAWPVGACGAVSAAVSCPTHDICQLEDTPPRPGDGDVDVCAGEPQPADALPKPGTCPPAPAANARRWRFPLTVFLANPCDVVRDEEACQVTPEARKEHERRRDDTTEPGAKP